MTGLRLGLVSMHTSPASEPGSGDAGGMNVVVLEQAKRLAAAGHTVDLITRRSDDGPDAVTLSPRLTLRQVDAGPHDHLDKGEHERHVEAFRRGLVEAGPYDLLHSHHWFSGMAALPVARERGIPHVQSFHSIAAQDASPLADGERAESTGRLAGEEWLARHSDAVVTVSDYEAGVALARLGARDDVVAVVPPGVDGTLFRPLGAGPRRPGYVAAAGRIHPLKGFDLAIDVIAMLPDGSRPRLIVAGEASRDLASYARSLRTRADRLDVEARFAGAQHRPQLAALFAAARAVLIPSHSETFGLVALEAAAAGVPVLAAASGGLREAVDDGVTGILVSSRDPGAWAQALAGLLSDDALADRLGRAGRERALRFTWQRSANRLLDVYRAVLGRGRMEL